MQQLHAHIELNTDATSHLCDGNWFKEENNQEQEQQEASKGPVWSVEHTPE